MGFRRATWLRAGLILLLVPVGLQVFVLARDAVGNDALRAAVWLVLAACGVLVALEFGRTRAKRGALLAVAVAGLIVAATPLFEAYAERVHLVLFGALGWSAYGDRRKTPGLDARAVAGALVLCLCVAAIDECLQSLMPDRHGQWKDVLLAVLGGMWGVAACQVAGLEPDPRTSR